MIKLHVISNNGDSTIEVMLPVSVAEGVQPPKTWNRATVLEPHSQIGPQSFVETLDEVATLLARFKQAEFDARNSRSVEYKLAQIQHGMRDFPAHDFPASVEIDEQGCAQINYGI